MRKGLSPSSNGEWIPDLPVLRHQRLFGAAVVALILSLVGGCLAPLGIVAGDAGEAAGPKNAWKLYQGAWFSIAYPGDFEPRPSLAADEGDSFDSAFFVATDGKVSFYVLSPQWRRAADDIVLLPARESRLEQYERMQEGFLMRASLFAARDGSYERLVESYVSTDQTVSWTFQFRYPGEHERKKYLPLYERFKASLKQFSD